MFVMDFFPGTGSAQSMIIIITPFPTRLPLIGRSNCKHLPAGLIDDLEEGVTGNILKFADATKLFRKSREIGDKKKLQDDIDK